MAINTARSLISRRRCDGSVKYTSLISYSDLPSANWSVWSRSDPHYSIKHVWPAFRLKILVGADLCLQLTLFDSGEAFSSLRNSEKSLTPLAERANRLAHIRLGLRPFRPQAAAPSALPWPSRLSPGKGLTRSEMLAGLRIISRHFSLCRRLVWNMQISRYSLSNASSQVYFRFQINCYGKT